MLDLATYLFFIFSAVYLLWTVFLAGMTLKRANNAGTLSFGLLALAIPIILFGYLLDITINALVLSVVMLELPHELLVTQRLSRHLHDSTGWRFHFARWIGDHLLDQFDPTGRHLQ